MAFLDLIVLSFLVCEYEQQLQARQRKRRNARMSMMGGAAAAAPSPAPCYPGLYTPGSVYDGEHSDFCCHPRISPVMPPLVFSPHERGSMFLHVKLAISRSSHQ